MHQRIQYLPPSSSASSSPPQPQIGTILYRGTVPPTRGEWLGIEWDDASRGKHSGVYEKTGIRYFRTRVEGAGSFLRPNAPGLILEGKSFVKAFKDKYLDLSTSSSSPAGGEATTSEFYKTESNFQVEVVMSEKVAKRFRELGRLREAGLEWECVDRASAAEEEESGEGEVDLAQLGTKLSGLEVLNLSCSMIPRFQEAERIVKVLPKLTVLSLNSNRFESLPSQPYYPSFERLRNLQLNNTLLTWPDVVRLSPSLPNLVTFQFGFNRLEVLEPSSGTSSFAEAEVPVLPKVETLNLEANELNDWTETIRELSKLPSLSTLVLASNRFDTLSLPPSSPDICLRKLRHLSLTSNLLSSWPTTIDALGESASSTFPSLESLRLEKNPLTSPSPSTATLESADGPSTTRDPTDLHLRLLLIARLPFLATLENTPITTVEREDAERFWVNRMGDNKGTLNELSDWARTRFEELRKKHFSTESTDSTASKASTAAPRSQPSLKSRLIRLRIVHTPPSTPSETPTLEETLELSVLPTLRTLLLRTQLSRLLGKPLPKAKFRLVAWLRSRDAKKEAEGEKWMRVEIPAKEEGRDVAWWGFEEGDAIEVEAL